MWITGASSGIGKEIAIQLSPVVKKIIITARTIDKLNALATAINAECVVIPCDLSDSRAVKEMLEERKQEFNQVDVVIHNAGVSQRSLAIETDMEVVRKIMELNFFGTVQLTKSILPQLKQNNGKIVVISSVAGKFGVPFRSTYSASKHALHGFYEALRIEEKVNVSMVCPGFIHTNISKNAVKADGSSYGEMDQGQANGMPVEKAVKQILRGLAKGKKEIYVGGFRETRLAVFMHNNFHALFYNILKKSQVK